MATLADLDAMISHIAFSHRLLTSPILQKMLMYKYFIGQGISMESLYGESFGSSRDESLDMDGEEETPALVSTCSNVSTTQTGAADINFTST